jgi:hypothetical protein
MKTLIAFLTIFFLSLLAKKVAIGLEEECIQYQEHDEENECQDADRVTRYYYSNETNTCTEYRTCISNETLGHKSVEDCNKKCRTMCPPLPANERFILQSCKDPYNCEAFYKCDGYYFVNGYARTCDNGVWSSIPICSNIAIYHDGVEKDNIEFTSSSFKSETLECRVLPSIPANTEIKWTKAGGNDELEGQWNEDNTGYQLTITNEGTYSCKVTLTNTKGLKKLITKSITIKTRDQIHSDDNLVIHSSNVLKSPDNRQITGQCFCEGTPKPLVSWYINGENYTNEQEIRDAMSSAKTLTLSLLTIVNVDPKIHSGVYTCGCSNSNNSLMGETHTISIPPSTGQYYKDVQVLTVYNYCWCNR